MKPTTGTKKINIRYFAALREQAGKSEDFIETTSITALELYVELKSRYNFALDPELTKVAINSEYKNMSDEIISGDEVVFIPPVAGG